MKIQKIVSKKTTIKVDKFKINQIKKFNYTIFTKSVQK